jgi:L-alanine-DL-glutamate epimerase-like enolase superfamily enzyme
VSPFTLFTATLRLAAPLAAANVVHDVRTSLFVRIDSDDVSGWSECPVAAGPGWDATVSEVFDALDAPSVSGTPTGTPGARAAQGLLATAHLDARLRRESSSLAHSLGVDEPSVRYAGVVGIADTEVAVDRARALVANGASRIRVKVAPRRGADAVRAVLDAVDVPVVADANGAFDPASTDDLRELHLLADLPLAWLEQPFAPGERRGFEALATRSVRLGADESVRSPEALAELVDDGVVSVVCIKPARVGVPVALELLERARRGGLATYVGGYFEAGLGRAALGVVSAAAASLDGDVAGPATYLVHDPCHLDGPHDGRQRLHDGPGVGPVPDLDALVVLQVFDLAPEPQRGRP